VKNLIHLAWFPGQTHFADQLGFINFFKPTDKKR
jgi:hypothetical protein